MSVMGFYFLFVGSIAIAWLWREGVTDAPWTQEGELPTYRGRWSRSGEPARAGLVIFLAVALCLFSLMCAAFFMRMEDPDWRLPTPPAILWVNSCALVLSSISLQIAASAATSDDLARTRDALMACALMSLLFLLGQLWAWREMLRAGFFASTNPANAFFFLLTGAHGLHLLGGLVALARTLGCAWRVDHADALARSVRLCAIYWHFLLAVWLVLFALLFGWADNFGAICRRWLS